MNLPKKQWLFLTLVLLIILIIDQWVKIWIKTSFDYADPSIPLLGEWLQLNYVENQGMAFGATLGGSIWGKLILSIFRVFAIGAIVYYLFKRINEGVSTEFIIVGGLVLAGALGNLIDSMFYDYIFEFDPCMNFNHLSGSGIWMECDYGGYVHEVEVRNTGFLFANVVDMFQFNVRWPQWTPWVAGEQVFPAIWNVADAAISSGVILILIRQKKYFPKN